MPTFSYALARPNRAPLGYVSNEVYNEKFISKIIIENLRLIQMLQEDCRLPKSPVSTKNFLIREIKRLVIQYCKNIQLF